MAASVGCGGARVITKPPSKRIVIVGAGLSGLVVAHELVKHGHEVMVIEATERPGGRIRTVRGFPAGQYAEAGAMHLVGNRGLPALLAKRGFHVERH